MARGIKANYVSCIDCGKKVATNNERAMADTFYKVGNFEGSNRKFSTTGVYDICKKCMKKKCYDDSQCKVFNKAKFIYVLKNVMNRPYVHEYFERTIKQCQEKPQSIFTEYMRRICAVGSFEKTWKDGDTFFANEELIANDKQEENNNTSNDIEDDVLDIKIEDNFKVTSKMIEFWGNNYKKSDYMFLEKEYGNLTTRFECKSYSQEMLFQEIALVRLDIKNKRERGENVDKELKTWQDLLGSANIKPVQESGANASSQECVGVLTKIHEDIMPIPEPEDEFKDVDGIQRYISTWFLGHLLKLAGKKGKAVDMYEKEKEKYTVKTVVEDGEE